MVFDNETIITNEKPFKSYLRKQSLFIYLLRAFDNGPNDTFSILGFSEVNNRTIHSFIFGKTRILFVISRVITYIHDIYIYYFLYQSSPRKNNAIKKELDTV